MSDRSPFESTSLVTMYLEPILNEYYRTYQTIITLSGMPEGPLKDLVAHINTPALSEFQTASNPYSNPRCKYVLLRFPNNRIRGSVKNGRDYMFAEDVPNIYGYLESHGYKLMDTSKYNFWRRGFDQRGFDQKEMVCIFTWHQE
jgi:hypothetical protein